MSTHALKFLLPLLLASCASTPFENAHQGETPAQTYKEDWASLAKKEEAPAWFQDAKLGIYAHWGPISKANENFDPGSGWYGMNMYMDKGRNWRTGEPSIDRKTGKQKGPHPAFKHHTKTFGDQNTVGYKDIIPQFNPTAFDPVEWAKLFKASGAKFAGPVAIHHDNFAMWDSDVTRWNVHDFTGLDVTGELKREIEAQGLKFITSFHHAHTWVYYALAHNYDATKETSDLYTDKHDFADHEVSQRFRDEWWAKLKEVIDKYEPDVAWFDFGIDLIPDEDLKKFMSYYYNKGEEWGKEVVVSYKNVAFPEETGVRDYERGRPNKIDDRFWMTDTSPGAWFYRHNAKFVDDNEIIDILIDIVSKNGLMLLNVPPNPDGSIPQEMKDLLLGMGDRLKINGEGIYGTRPWTVFGEGPTRLKAGGHKIEKEKIIYTQNDIRFTYKQSGELYMFVMDKPDANIVVKSLGRNMAILNKEISSITMLGSDEEIKWTRTADSLTIDLPEEFPSELAIGFKIETTEIKDVGKVGYN